MASRLKIVVAVLAVVVGLGVVLHLLRDDMPFTSREWKAAGPAVFNERSPRGRMLGDLRGRVLQPGMTREEVVQLLGEPDRPWDGKELVYYVGPAQFIPEAAFVIVELEDDVLVRHRITTD